MSALIDDAPTAFDDALGRVGVWSPGLAEKAASTHVRSYDLAWSALTDLVMRDASPAVCR